MRRLAPTLSSTWAQADLGRLTIHETACKGLRFCGACNVVAHDEALQGDLFSGIATNSSVPCSTAQVMAFDCMPQQHD